MVIPCRVDSCKLKYKLTYAVGCKRGLWQLCVLNENISAAARDEAAEPLEL